MVALNTASTATVWRYTKTQEVDAFLRAREGYFIAQRLVVDDEARLAAAQIPNGKLLAIAKKFRPPQAWYDADEENLF